MMIQYWWWFAQRLWLTYVLEALPQVDAIVNNETHEARWSLVHKLATRCFVGAQFNALCSCFAELQVSIRIFWFIIDFNWSLTKFNPIKFKIGSICLSQFQENRYLQLKDYKKSSKRFYYLQSIIHFSAPRFDDPWEADQRSRSNPFGFLIPSCFGSIGSVLKIVLNLRLWSSMIIHDSSISARLYLESKLDCLEALQLSREMFPSIIQLVYTGRNDNEVIAVILIDN